LKKIILFLTFLWGQLFAMDVKSTVDVYSALFDTMMHKTSFRVYLTDKELKEALSHSDRFKFIQDPLTADIIILNDEADFQKVEHYLSQYAHISKPILFATNYHLLEAHPEIVGALYWKKGRSQLLFIKPRLQKYHIQLPETYAPFIIEAL
jgi:hypothetical protein